MKNVDTYYENKYEHEMADYDRYWSFAEDIESILKDEGYDNTFDWAWEYATTFDLPFDQYNLQPTDNEIIENYENRNNR